MKRAWLLPTEAGRVLGISASGVRWLADTRRLRAIRTPSGRRLVSAMDLERLRRERKRRHERLRIPPLIETTTE